MFSWLVGWFFGSFVGWLVSLLVFKAAGHLPFACFCEFMIWTPLSLQSKADKGVGFRLLNELNTVTVVEKVVDLLPALCQQIEAIGSFFQVLCQR